MTHPRTAGARATVRKFIRSRVRKVGMPPGSMVHIGEQKVERVLLSVVDYSAETIVSRELATVEDAFPFLDSVEATWLNVTGLHDPSIITAIGTHVGIHPLILEDILHTDQRPKVEITDDSVYIVLKMLAYDVDRQEIQAEQISLILGPTFVITFQEREGTAFDPLRQRLGHGGSKARKLGPDYLTYAIIDIIIDRYFLVLEQIGEQIELLEADVLKRPDPALVGRIQHMKRELIFLRKATWPLREVISGLSRDDTALIHHDTAPYLRDLHDHTVQVIDMVETFRDMTSGLLDIYLSSVSNRMNEVMKVLTIIATIFIPLTFIVGVYGMNFDVMPELRWRWGYPALWLLMLGIVIGMVGFFRHRRWF